MGKFNLQEKDLLSLDHDFYFIVKEEGYYYVDKNKMHPENYNVYEFIDLLTVEECKFLIAEAALDSTELKEYFVRELHLSKPGEFQDIVRSLEKTELNELISILKYTRNFNGYLSYMLGDWKSDNFETEEQRMSFIY